MMSNRLALAALATACVAAAGVGGYMASRQNPAPVAASAPTAPQVQAPTPGPAAAIPVQETEAVVGGTAKSSAQEPQARAGVPAQRPSARRTPPASRRVPAATEAEQARIEPVQVGPAEPPQPAAAPAAEAQAAPSRAEDRPPVEPPQAPEPAAPTFEELVVSADSVIGLQTEHLVSSDRARVEDRVDARVVRDVRVGGAVAIPARTRAEGSVVVVERGGRFKERARLGIRFHALVLADGSRLPITTETIYRYGEAPGNDSAKKVGGGAVAGAILGAIIGGGKGAAIGATAGAGAGTAVVMTGDRSAAAFAPGTEVTARILSPLTVTVEK
jgi:hypothetical protein